MIGYIYVLLDPASPKNIKIGKSSRGGQYRATELSNSTASALPFVLAYEAMVSDFDLAEKIVHDELAAYRINPAREFFRLDLSKAIEVINSTLIKYDLLINSGRKVEYKFIQQNFDSPVNLFNVIMSSVHNWERALVHLKEGFITQWLKRIREHDALIANKTCRSQGRSDDFTLASIIINTLPDKNISIFGFRVENRGFLKQIYTSEARSFLFDDRLFHILTGLNSSGEILQIQQHVKSLNFLQSKADIEHKDRMFRKYISWKLREEEYFKTTIVYSDLNNLRPASDIREAIASLHLPNFVFEYVKDEIIEGNYIPQNHLFSLEKHYKSDLYQDTFFTNLNSLYRKFDISDGKTWLYSFGTFAEMALSLWYIDKLNSNDYYIPIFLFEVLESTENNYLYFHALALIRFMSYVTSNNGGINKRHIPHFSEVIDEFKSMFVFVENYRKEVEESLNKTLDGYDKLQGRITDMEVSIGSKRYILEYLLQLYQVKNFSELKSKVNPNNASKIIDFLVEPLENMMPMRIGLREKIRSGDINDRLKLNLMYSDSYRTILSWTLYPNRDALRGVYIAR